MKKPINQLLIPLLATFVLVFSCGESDSPTQTVSSSSSTTKEDELSLDEQVVEIDLVAEEAAIRTEHQALVEDINSRDRDPNIVTAHWLERG